MPCDGNWHNKESFYPYWKIKNNQYIGRIDSLLIHKQGKSHVPRIIYLPRIFCHIKLQCFNSTLKWALISIKHLVKVYSTVRLLTCVMSETKPNAYFSDWSHKSHLPAGTMEVGIEATCQRAAIGEIGVTRQPVCLPLKLDFLDVLQVQRRWIPHFTKSHVKIYSCPYII